MQWLITAVVVALIAGVIQAAPGVVGRASAHGEEDRFEIFRGQEGPYLVIVGIQPEKPVVGTVHISITALEAETLLPVDFQRRSCGRIQPKVALLSMSSYFP